MNPQVLQGTSKWWKPFGNVFQAWLQLASPGEHLQHLSEQITPQHPLN
jgi:hypothetical protein